METAEKKEQYVYAPSRIYSQSRAATAEALPNEQPQRHSRPTVPAQTPAPKKNPRHDDKSRVETRRVELRRFAKRTLSVIAVFAAAAVIIGVLVRYATISREYLELNKVKSNITLAEQRIAELNVRLNSVISLDDARETAQDAGLGYPTADQIVDVQGKTNSGAGGVLTEPQE